MSTFLDIKRGRCYWFTLAIAQSARLYSSPVGHVNKYTYQITPMSTSNRVGVVVSPTLARSASLYSSHVGHVA